MIEKTVKYFALFLLIFLISGINLFAQNNSKIQLQFENAVKLYNLSEYENAVSELEKLLKKNPDFVDANLLLADIYHDTGKTNQEIAALEKAIQFSKNTLILFRLAKANYSLGNYEKALFYFEKYQQSTGISEVRKAEINRNIQSCRFAIDAMKVPVDFKPERLPATINTENSEYWPCISLDGKMLVFTRLQKIEGKIPQEDFFISQNDSAGWEEATPIIEINTFENEGAQALSADGSLLFFTACNRADGYGSCDIYYSVFNGLTWSVPRNAGKTVNSSYWDAQPSISSDNRFLYFSSNRSGGKGNKDIWRAELLEIQNDGTLKWRDAKNIGDKINTPGDEISPFLHANNKSFYFASDFLEGMGGLDLFVSEIQLNGAFGEPKNLGFPINTFSNEQGLNISSDGSTAFFASEREPGFGLDIFTFNLPKALRVDPVTYVKARISDAENGKNIRAVVELQNLSSDSVNQFSKIADENGEILLCLPLNSNYAFNVSQSGYLFYSQSIQLENSNTVQNPYLLNIQLEPIKIGAEMNLYNIYFETDSFRILSDSEPELHKLSLFLKNNSQLVVEIQGHTDNSGQAENNQKLSDLRAKSVVEYLVKEGIPENRLQYKGYGETMPVATNDTDEGRKLNRRTTVKIQKN